METRCNKARNGLASLFRRGCRRRKAKPWRVGVSTRMLIVKDGGSLWTVASRSPGVECAALVVGVSTRVFSVIGFGQQRACQHCDSAVTSGGMSYLGSRSLGSSFQCDHWWFGVRSERAWHPCEDWEERRRALHYLGDPRNDQLVRVRDCPIHTVKHSTEETLHR